MDSSWSYEAHKCQPSSYHPYTSSYHPYMENWYVDDVMPSLHSIMEYNPDSIKFQNVVMFIRLYTNSLVGQSFAIC